MKKRIVHLFRVPNKWNNEKIHQFISKFKEVLESEKNSLLTRKEVEYIALPIEEGDRFAVIRKGDEYRIE